MAVCLILAGCSLPPPAEDKPLSGKLDDTFHVDSTVAGAADSRAISRSPGGSDGQSTTVVEVQESSGSNLEPVGDATETVHGEAAEIDSEAVERDPEVDPPVGVESELEPRDLGATISDGQTAEASVQREQPGGVGAPVLSPGPGKGEGTPEERAGADVVGPFTIGQYATDDGASMTFEVGGPLVGASTGAATEPGPSRLGTVVFIHGWCGDRAQWQSQMETLVSESKVLSVDLLGHGDSPSAGREEWTIPRYGRDVAGLIETRDLRDVILVGHAMGGQVALEVALRIPERVAAVIGVESLHELNVDPGQSADAKSAAAQGLDVYLKAFQEDFMAEFRRFIESAVHSDTAEPIRQRIEADAERCDPVVGIKLMKHFQTRDLKSVVRAIECPVHCINSSIFKTDIKGNRLLLPGFDAVEMQGVGFWPHLEQPGAFQTELVLQLKKVRVPKELAAPATLTALRPVLFCDDMETLRAFYVDRLRFEERSRQPQDLEQPATLITLERDGLTLQLQSRSSLATDLPGVEGVAAGGQLLFLSVTDLASERIQLGPDVKLEIPIRTLESGSQQTVLRDPVGNVIVLQQAARVE